MDNYLYIDVETYSDLDLTEVVFISMLARLILKYF